MHKLELDLLQNNTKNIKIGFSFTLILTTFSTENICHINIMVGKVGK